MTTNDNDNIKTLFDTLNGKEVLNLDNSTEDGRVNSFNSESMILNYIKNNFIFNNNDFKISQTRSWCDFTFKGTPFNVKVSNMNSYDNINSTQGFVYAFTGKIIKSNNKQEMIDLLAKSLEENYNSNHDYGFLVVDKNTKKMYISSMKNLSVKNLKSNGSNLPFQCKWSFLDDTLDHSVKDQSYKVIKVFYESFVKRLKINLSALQYYFNKDNL